MVLRSGGQPIAVLQEEADKNRNGSKVALMVGHGAYDAKVNGVPARSDESNKFRELLQSVLGKGSTIVGDFYSLEDGKLQPLVGILVALRPTPSATTLPS